MNNKVKIGSKCRVYLHNPSLEDNASFIEGKVVDIDNEAECYKLDCTFDSAFDDKKDIEHKELSRKGEIMCIPIHPEQGDFDGRIVVI